MEGTGHNGEADAVPAAGDVTRAEELSPVYAAINGFMQGAYRAAVAYFKSVEEIAMEPETKKSQ